MALKKKKEQEKEKEEEKQQEEEEDEEAEEEEGKRGERERVWDHSRKAGLDSVGMACKAGKNGRERDPNCWKC